MVILFPIRDAQAKQDAKLRDVLDLAGERQSPVTGLAPRATRRVQAAGSGVFPGHEDHAVDQTIGVNAGAQVAVVVVGRRREILAFPAIAFAAFEEVAFLLSVDQGLELELLVRGT